MRCTIVAKINCVEKIRNRREKIIFKSFLLVSILYFSDLLRFYVCNNVTILNKLFLNTCTHGCKKSAVHKSYLFEEVLNTPV